LVSWGLNLCIPCWSLGFAGQNIEFVVTHKKNLYGSNDSTLTECA